MNFHHSSFRKEVCAVRHAGFIPDYYKAKGIALQMNLKNHRLAPLGSQRLTDLHCSEKV